MRRFAVVFLLTFALTSSAPSADAEKNPPAREALKPFNLLIGTWKGSGIPEGSIEDRNKGHWTESVTWEWQFKGDDAWIALVFEKGKYFKTGELRHVAGKNLFQLKLETLDKQTCTFEGTFKEKALTLERIDDKTKETQRLVFSLLHSNRIVYRYEVKPTDKTFFTKIYRVGATKDGEPFVEAGFNEKECIVSGGTGTSTVSFQGKTYYVCCSGCRDEFYATPAKYVAEFEKKREAFNKKK